MVEVCCYLLIAQVSQWALFPFCCLSFLMRPPNTRKGGLVFLGYWRSEFDALLGASGW